MQWQYISQHKGSALNDTNAFEAYAESNTLNSLTDQTFKSLSAFIYERTGIFYPEKKKYLLEARIRKRLQTLGIQEFEEYDKYLRYGQHQDNEFSHLYGAITTNETSFFRNIPQLEAFATSVVPSLFKSHGNSVLRIWSAGSSSGEEAYSYALLYLERLLPAYPGLRIEIVGTDISQSVLKTAQAGEYGRYAIRNLPQNYLDKYFVIDGDRYRLREEVKEFVTFQNLNLMDRQQVRSMKNFHIILCCNVLIYFDQKAKIQVVSDLYNCLNFGGFFFVGFSELLHGISSAFRLISYPHTTGYRKE
jgi:chemotaxis protein methyltransferase CheR